MLLAKMPITYYNDLVRYPKAFTYIIEESIATKDTLKIICFCQLIIKETSSFQYLIFFDKIRRCFTDF